MMNDDVFFTPKEIAAMLKISYEAALSFIKYSGIDFIQIGKQYRVEQSTFKAFFSRKGNITVDISEAL